MTATLLIVESTIVGVTVAAARVDRGRAKVLARVMHPENAGSVAAIARVAQAAAAEFGHPVTECDGLVVSTGPGSFTGIKVGLAFAAGVRLGRTGARPGPWPTLGLSGLSSAALAWAEQGTASEAAILLPATRTHGFLGYGQPSGVGWAALVDLSAEANPDARSGNENQQRAAAFLARCQGRQGAQLGLGGRWPLAEERFRGHDLALLDPPEVCRLSVCGMAELAARAWPHGFVDAAPEPQYLRLSTAEENRLAGS